MTTQVTGSAVVVRLSGEVDLCQRSHLVALARQLARCDCQIVVDLSDATFCDGTVAAFLAELLAGGRSPSRHRAGARASSFPCTASVTVCAWCRDPTPRKVH